MCSTPGPPANATAQGCVLGCVSKINNIKPKGGRNISNGPFLFMVQVQSSLSAGTEQKPNKENIVRLCNSCGADTNCHQHDPLWVKSKLSIAPAQGANTQLNSTGDIFFSPSQHSQVVISSFYESQ